jgi:hypothetical protein
MGRIKPGLWLTTLVTIQLLNRCRSGFTVESIEGWSTIQGFSVQIFLQHVGTNIDNDESSRTAYGTLLGAAKVGVFGGGGTKAGVSTRFSAFADTIDMKSKPFGHGLDFLRSAQWCY